MMTFFTHLHLHTEYSLKDGLIRIEDLVKKATDLKMPAVAITDANNIFATIKFYQAALSAGLKPIIGAECFLENVQNPSLPFRITFLCQNYQGYKNLTTLITRTYLEGQTTGDPILKRSWLADTNEGLLVLSGAQEGDIGQSLLTKNETLTKEFVDFWLQVFPNRFYLEVQRIGKDQEEEYLTAAIQLAQQQNIPVVATNNVRFLNREDFDAHEARVCIANSYILSDPKRPQNYTENQYLRSAEEMAALFSEMPEVLMNTMEIAKRCNLELVLEKTYLPNFPLPKGETIESYFEREATAGFNQRFNFSPENDQKKIYLDRLKHELTVINSMGFASYFLIVADFIRWAKNQGIPVGPGRGSGAGSLVAYVLQITDFDPLLYDLLFERFLNPERVSLPDFDIDFCMDGRDRVIEYVAERYGRDAVCQIITFGSMAARGVVRDVGRVLGYPYGLVDKLAKLIPFELGITLDKALKQEEELKRRYQEEDEVKSLIDLARKLEGLARNVGKHAAGVVIAPAALTDFTPLYCEAGGTDVVTQYDMEDIQTVGLVKFDFLGLRTLTIIDWAIQTINQKRALKNEPAIDITKITVDDPKTFELLKSCQTTAVFQLESRGMKDLVKRLKPDCLEDIIALVALFRPGPLQSGMVDDFINCKHGRAKIEYLHPMLEPILKPTYGIILYQEQVMQIAQVLAGYTLGKADLLRRAMGKKKADEMANHRAIFILGAKNHGVAENIATNIFALMEKFADYGFNKSHSAAYAILAYQTAWLKAHYPAEFMAAVLSSDMDHTDKVVGFIHECRTLKLKVLPPNINQSFYKFTVTEDGSILYGLGAVKGLGEAAILSVVANREQEGPYRNFSDLCFRLDSDKLNRRSLEALIRSGSLDSLGSNRASMFAAIDSGLQAALQSSRHKKGRQHDLFSESSSLSHEFVVPIQEEWSSQDFLAKEKETLGFYISGHPIHLYRQEMVKFTTTSLANLEHSKSQSVIIAGWVINIRKLYTKRGDLMAIVMLEDEGARLELAVFSDVFKNHQDQLNVDQLLIVEGEVSVDEVTDSQRIIARRLLTIEKARENFKSRLVIRLSFAEKLADFSASLQTTLLPFCHGNTRVIIEYESAEGMVELQLGDEWLIKPVDALLKALHKLVGNDKAFFEYSC